MKNSNYGSMNSSFILRMIKSALAVLVISLIICPMSYARPPTALDLQYDVENKILTIDVKHVTKNPRKHHIRKLVVFKNGEELEIFRYVTQATSQGFSQEFSMDTEEGDVIRVKAYCNEAGIKEELLVVTMIEPAP